MLVHLLLKRPKTRDGHADEAPAAESKPDVIDVEMFEDPSIPCEQFPDEEMPPGYFEDEQPMDVEKEVVERPEPMGVESEDVSVEPRRVARRLEQVRLNSGLHPTGFPRRFDFWKRSVRALIVP